MSAYTIVAFAGDNGTEYAIGRFGSLERAAALATKWMEEENPHREGDGMHYAAVRIQGIREWRATP